jgi:hypothetical protein
MKNSVTLDISTIVFVAVVHAVSGVGLGLWLSDRVPIRHRRTIAFTLIALGATLHVPMRRAVMHGRQRDGKALSA